MLAIFFARFQTGFRSLLHPTLSCLLILGGVLGNEAKGVQDLGSSAITAEQASIIAAGRKDNQVQVHLDYLTNKLGPRLTGSHGLQVACEWAQDYFTSLGLQNSRMEKWGEFPVGFDRGASQGKMLSPKEMNFVFATNAWTPGTKGNMVGRAMLVPKTMEDLEKNREAFKGAFIFSTRSARAGMRGRRARAEEAAKPDDAAQTDEAKKAEEDRALQAKIREELAKCEIAAYVQPTADELVLTGGNYQISWDNLPKDVSINLQRGQWDEVVKLLDEGQEVKVSFDIRNHFRKGPVPLYNVIAEIPGTEKPDEMVIVGGHIDSWDGATGATDNGAGCATTFEAARILVASGIKPKRTIRFMLWSGEEQGLLGSLAYVDQHPEEMPKISAVLVHDGGTNYVAGIGGTKSMLEIFEKVFAPAKSLDPKAPFEIREVEQIRPAGGSDHVSFIQKGVPGFFWDQKGRATYRNTHHTQYDTYDVVVPEYQEHSSIVIALGAFGIAQLDELLPRDGVQPPR